MAALSDNEILTAVKNGIGITGDYQDETLMVYVNEVIDFMINAGVSENVVRSNAAVGCIMRGVVDLWDYGNGTAKLSDYFKMRVVQLSCRKNASE